jgi:hypothetical protein
LGMNLDVLLSLPNLDLGPPLVLFAVGEMT